MNYLVIYTTNNCTTCKRVVNTAKSVSKLIPNVTLQIKDYKEAERKLTIVPAVFLNKHLFCYGDFDKDRLINKIEKQSK